MLSFFPHELLLRPHESFKPKVLPHLQQQMELLQFPSTYAPPLEPEIFSDDDPLPDNESPSSPSQSHFLALKASPEFPAIVASESVSTFAVLVGIRAPPLFKNGSSSLSRAPVDLVTVLDVSGSMAGDKLALLKRAMCFVIENLGSSDRLSIVAFETNAQRVFPLSRMSEKGRQDARTAVNSLQASGSTDIVKGLSKGVRVLNERRHRNPVSSIILLSGGNDTYNYNRRSYSGMKATNSDSNRVVQYLKHLPSCICPSNSPNGEQTYPVHTFGFGNDHGSNVMHAIADASGGTYSFIEAVQIVQEAFARCIGGLLSVVAQELRLMIRSASSGVIISAIPSGRCSSAILDDGQRGMIGVGDVYADEEKQFLVYVSVPKSLDMEKETALLDIECSYKDPMYTAAVKTDGKRVTVRRPEAPSDGDKSVCLEVDQQRNRVLVAEAISEAQKLADSGNLEGAMQSRCLQKRNQHSCLLHQPKLGMVCATGFRLNLK